MSRNITTDIEEKDVLWKDECQPLEKEQMEAIKSQFHPSNTANVNVVPYEIYDEDGVEQVVGEVRKTIDGVKKRKPLYRKCVTVTIVADDFSDAIISNVDYMYCEGITIFTSRTDDYWSNGVYSTYNLVGEGTRYGCVNKKDNGDVRLYNVSRSSSATITAIICYTKTTDEWTPV